MKPHIGVAGLALMAATLVACGGGGASPFVAPALPSTSSASIVLSTSTTTSAQLSEISNSSSATATFPVVSAQADARVTLQSALPSGATQPQTRSLGGRVPSAIGGSNISVLDYVEFSVVTATTISQTPSFSFTLSSPASGNAYIAMMDLGNPSAGWNVILGPGTTSGNTVAFTGTTLVPSIALQPNDNYVFALFTASGVATPTPLPNYPGGSGSSFAFSGSQTLTDTYAYPTPSPLPPTSVTSSITEQVSVGSSPFPSGSPAATDLHEVLTVAGPLASQITNTDAWYGLTAGSAPGLALFGDASTDNANNSMTVLYTTPNTIDLLPEANGASWTNSTAGTTNATFADGETLTRTDNADGSYSETTTDTLSHHYTFVLSGSANGSGSYSGTAFTALGIQTLNASAPVNGAIIVSILPTASVPNPNPTPVVLATPAAWFTPTGKLYSEADIESTNVRYPTACSVPSQFGFQGTHISQTIDRIDPMIGTHEHIVNDTYNGPLGPVCMTLTDTLTENYDYLLDTFSSWYDLADFSGQATHVHAITQTLTLQNAAISADRKAASATTSALSPAAISAARAQFALSIATARHSLVMKTLKRVEAKIENGGLK